MADIIPANFGRIIARRAVPFVTDPPTTTYTVVPQDDYVVAVDDVVITLLSAASVPAGWVVLLGNADGSANTVTVEPDGEDTIGGVAGGLTLTGSAQQVQLISDGVSNWETVRAGT